MFEFIYSAVGSNISRALDRCVNAVSRQCSQWIRKCFKPLFPSPQSPFYLCLPDILVQTEGFNIGEGKNNMAKLMPSVTLGTFSSLATVGIF